MTSEEIYFETPIAQRYNPIIHFYAIPGLHPKPKAVKHYEFIINTVLTHFGFQQLSNITGKCRKRNLVYPRQVCCYLLSKHSNLTMSAIGQMFGGRDHTTVIHSRDTIKDLLDVDENVRSEISQLTEKIERWSFTLQMSERAKH